MTSKPKPPSNLESAGRALWTEILSKYDLRADELRCLEDACASTDMLTALEEEWRSEGKPMTARGSMGQLVEHPLIGSIDKQRKTRQAFLRQLKLPDDPRAGRVGRGSRTTSTSARHAALIRWHG